MRRVPTRPTRRKRCSGTSPAQLPRPERRRRSGWKKAPLGSWTLRLRDLARVHSSLGGCLTLARPTEVPARRSTSEPRRETPILSEASWRRSPKHPLGSRSVHPGRVLASQIRPSHSEKWMTLPSPQPPRHPSHSVLRSCSRQQVSAPVRPRILLPSTSRRGPGVAKTHLDSLLANNSHPLPQVVRSVSVKDRPLHPLRFHLRNRMGQSRAVRPPSPSRCHSGSDLGLPRRLRTPSASRVRRLSQQHHQAPPDSLLANNRRLRPNRQPPCPPSRPQGHHSRLVVHCSI